MKTEAQIERLLKICLTAIGGSETEQQRAQNAAMALGIAWVLDIPGPTEKVDKMIEQCNIMDARKSRLARRKNRNSK